MIPKTAANIKLNLELGQHILVNKDVLNKIIELADLKKTDNILEIGAGTGILTKALAKKAKQVIAFEIDAQFEQALAELPKNTKIIWQDILKYIEQTKQNQLIVNKIKLNKIVANMPYHICEPLMYKLLFQYNYELAVWLVPKTFADFLSKNILAKSILAISLHDLVDNTSFAPQPRVKSQIVLIKPKKEYNLNTENVFYLIRQLYFKSNMKLKNALRESLIEVYIYANKQLTKKQAKEIISNLKLTKQLLESKVTKSDYKIYQLIADKINDEIHF